jgi:hypothetical protein
MAVHVLYLTVVISVHVWLDLQVHNVKVQLFSTALSYYTIRSSTFFNNNRKIFQYNAVTCTLKTFKSTVAFNESERLIRLNK